MTIQERFYRASIPLIIATPGVALSHWIKVVSFVPNGGFSQKLHYVMLQFMNFGRLHEFSKTKLSIYLV